MTQNKKSNLIRDPNDLPSNHHKMGKGKNSAGETIRLCLNCNISELALNTFDVWECEPEKKSWMTLPRSGSVKS